jgi:SAM-dependent methyltransferase
MPTGGAGSFGCRENLAGRVTEAWRPPLFDQGRTRWQRGLAALRRVLDLQAGSIWRDLAAELPTVRGALLDVGCGAQPYRGLLRSDVAYLGIDSIHAKAHFGYEIPGTRYFSGVTWPVETESIDVVLCVETLEHVLDPPAFLREMHRCLRPGGRVILTVPFAARWHFIPHDYWRFTPSGLKHLFNAAGFAEVEIYARGNSLTVACYKQMALCLPLLLPQHSAPVWRWTRWLLGVLASPAVLLLAVAGQASLRARGGDDCLGYTVLARRDDHPDPNESGG